MWLGFSAAFIGMFYALVKFLTVYQLRRLNNDFISAQHELQKTQQRLGKLDEKLKIEHSKKRTIEREIKDLQKRNDQLYARLSANLPKGVLSQLERCRALVAENTVREYKMLHDLQLKDNSEEFDTIVLDIEILQQQKDSLEAQETCMDNLDQFNTAPTVKKEKK